MSEDGQRGPGTTQSMKRALIEMGFRKDENQAMNLPEKGLDLAKHITSTSGVVGLLAVAMTAGLFALLWVILGQQQDALGTVATHQSAMQRRLDVLADNIEDLEREVRLSRAPQWMGERAPYAPGYRRDAPDPREEPQR